MSLQKADVSSTSQKVKTKQKQNTVKSAGEVLVAEFPQLHPRLNSEFGEIPINSLLHDMSVQWIQQTS